MGIPPLCAAAPQFRDDMEHLDALKPQQIAALLHAFAVAVHHGVVLQRMIQLGNALLYAGTGVLIGFDHCLHSAVLLLGNVCSCFGRKERRSGAKDRVLPKQRPGRGSSAGGKAGLAGDASGASVLSIILQHKIAFVKGDLILKMHNSLLLTSFLDEYVRNDTFRAHMPGHKGRTLPEFSELSGAYARDITEISGADSLFEADGILRSGERCTAALYGSADCCWSAGGSTLCIQAMIARMKAENRRIIAARTVHRAFLNACVLMGLEVEWIFPRSGGLIAGEYDPADFAAALECTDGDGCVYVTSPDYCGNMQDIRTLSALCKRHGARLLVDNAHGAHLAFLRENLHPMALGADLCCDSAHKMLPSLTGAAILHSAEIPAAELKQDMTLFGSTSPSYLIMQSIEAAMDWLSQDGAEQVKTSAERAGALRAALPAYSFAGDDPLHLTIRADGNDLAAQLRAQNVECEYADSTCLVLLLSPVMTEEDFTRLEAALRACEPHPAPTIPDLPPPPEQAVPMREAALGAWETVPLSDAVGRICGPVQVPCPPAVPILVSGERITEDWIRLMEFYGIGHIAVMRER
jgi:hypothetical protein